VTRLPVARVAGRALPLMPTSVYEPVTWVSERATGSRQLAAVHKAPKLPIKNARPSEFERIEVVAHRSVPVISAEIRNGRRLLEMCALSVRRCSAVFVLSTLACESTSANDPRNLTGTYSYTANGINVCTEQAVLPLGYQCTCEPPRSAQGTLELAFVDGLLAGQLRVSTCTGDSCGPEETLPLLAEDQRIWADTVAFFLINGPSPSNNSGSWSHLGRWTANGIGGVHERRDGNIRGCGNDEGSFTAQRQ